MDSREGGASCQNREPGDLPSNHAGPGGAPRAQPVPGWRLPRQPLPRPMPRPRREEGPTRPMRDVVIHVCVTCRHEGWDPEAPRPGARLHAALTRLAPPARIVAVECLGNCRRACTVSLSAPGAWTYVFGDLTPEAGPDVVVAAGLLGASADGLMPWRGRPEPFKRGMIARIPPFPTLEDAAE